jgi:hypothetical protein
MYEYDVFMGFQTETNRYWWMRPQDIKDSYEYNKSSFNVMVTFVNLRVMWNEVKRIRFYHLKLEK